jgi:hypothetical protein
MLTLSHGLLKINRSPSPRLLTAHPEGGSHEDATTVQMA